MRLKYWAIAAIAAMIPSRTLAQAAASGPCAGATCEGPQAPAASFTLVAVGDLILSRPISMLRHPGAFPEAKGLADALALLAQGDVTYGNMETSILDSRSFTGYPYSWNGDWMLTAVPAIVPDLQAMGFDILSRANNHALDWGVDGMRSTIAQLQGRFASAGTGETLAAATAPAFFSSPSGEVGIVSMVSTYRPTTDALGPDVAAPAGRPGVNPLTVTQTALVDASTFARVAEVACSFGPPGDCASKPSAIDLFGAAIRPAATGETAFTYTYAMDTQDVSRNVAAVKQAKARARYVLATIHAHEALSDEAPPATWQNPAAFLKPLAEAMIDAGADAFLVTGIHHVAGVDIYKGKPIFYGLGNFFWSDMQEPLSAELYGSIASRDYLSKSFEYPGRATDADLTNILNANSTFATVGDPSLNRTFQAVLTRTAYDDATRRVTSIRLYPIDLGYGEKLTQSGVPRQAGPVIANAVLDRMIRLSAGGGLAITKTIENGYVIAVASPR